MSLSVTISQFAGGVTEIPPTPALISTSNYLWEIMGRYGIAAQSYTGTGGGVVIGPGGSGVIGSGKVPFKLVVTISGSSGTDQGSTYQNNDLINAVDVDYFFLGNAVYQINTNSFTFNSLTGTIDISISSNRFFGQDKLVIPYAKFINVQATVPSAPLNTTIYFMNVATYDLAWTPAYMAIYGRGADFSVEVLNDDGTFSVLSGLSISPDSIDNTTSYHFDFGGVSTGRIIF